MRPNRRLDTCTRRPALWSAFGRICFTLVEMCNSSLTCVEKQLSDTGRMKNLTQEDHMVSIQVAGGSSRYASVRDRSYTETMPVCHVTRLAIHEDVCSLSMFQRLRIQMFLRVKGWKRWSWKTCQTSVSPRLRRTIILCGNGMLRRNILTKGAVSRLRWTIVAWPQVKHHSNWWTEEHYPAWSSRKS